MRLAALACLCPGRVLVYLVCVRQSSPVISKQAAGWENKGRTDESRAGAPVPSVCPGLTEPERAEFKLERMNGEASLKKRKADQP